jgi:hypothetical protein
MIGSLIAGLQQQQFRNLEFDLNAAISSYGATRSQEALLGALKTQTRMMDLLLAANNLQTPQSLHLSILIQSL